MQIVDAQIHIGSQGLPSNDAHRRTTSVPAEKIVPLMDEAGMAGGVLHPPSWDPNGHAVAATAAQGHPGLFAVLGTMALEGQVAGLGPPVLTGADRTSNPREENKQ